MRSPRWLARAAWALGVGAAALGASPRAAAAQAGVERRYLDTTCSPCRDFYQFANGGWLRTAAIPPADASTGVGREVVDSTTATLRRVLELAAARADTAPPDAIGKVGAFYASCMDSTAADRAGVGPIAAELAAIDSVRTRAALERVVAHLMTLSIFAPLYFSSEPDPKESSREIGQLYQAGLGLPDRDYYLRTDPGSDSLRQAYRAHVTRIFELLGSATAPAAADADRVIRMETALAESSMTLEQQRDPTAIYHRMTVQELDSVGAGVDWAGFFQMVGVPSLDSAGATLDVSQPAFVRLVSATLATAPLEDWRAYLRWQLADAVAPELGAAFFAEDFQFLAHLEGVREPQPRWKRCAAATDHALGEALGQAYVAVAFPAASKARVLTMVDNLQRAFAARIQAVTWMSDSTKVLARAKLAALVKKIGYPDHWRDYSGLPVRRAAPYATNALRARVFEARRQLDKIGHPVDRTEWLMTPPTVNAYYDPATNEITFPAAILQRPFFEPDADDAFNYGSIGAIIGHEMTHGFDDQGRQFDAAGNLRNWWTAEDATRFAAHTARLVAQFNRYVAVDTLHVNGALTLGENIADLGGLAIAYDAYEASRVGQPPVPLIDGFTPEQRFFLAYAQSWRTLERPEAVRLGVLTDPHAPPPWRVDGPMSDLPAFARAFGCQAGDAMVAPDSARAAIW